MAVTAGVVTYYLQNPLKWITRVVTLHATVTILIIVGLTDI